MVERCPDKTEVVGPIPTTRTQGGNHFYFTTRCQLKDRNRRSDSYHTHKALKPFLFMENNKNNNAPWWRDGVIIFAKVSAYIAFPVIIASYAGKYLDQKYNTGNFMFLGLIVIAFISTTYLIWKEMKIYKKKIEKEEIK